MPKKHIEEQWQKYSKVAIRSDATQEEVMECRSAFFAGIHLVMAVILGGTEDVDALFDDLKAEIEEFHAAKRTTA